MKENNKVIVSNSLLVGAGKSSRLAAIRDKAQQQSIDINKQPRQFSKQLKLENKAALQHAVNLIEQRMAEILRAYPVGKKNTFFKIKYGIKVDEIRKMSIKQDFHLLQLNSIDIHKFHLIENLDFSGKTAV